MRERARGGGVIAARACKRENLRQFMRRLWYCHNAINVYHVVIPWRREVTFQEMGSGRNYTRPDKVNNKDDKACHPHTHTERKLPAEPARLCSEQEASEWFTAGSAPWYYAQGLTPPGEDGEKAREQGNEG